MTDAQEAQEAAAAAAKAAEEEDKQKAEEAARKAEELAAVQREMDEKKAKDRAMLEVSCSVPALLFCTCFAAGCTIVTAQVCRVTMSATWHAAQMHHLSMSQVS